MVGHWCDTIWGLQCSCTIKVIASTIANNNCDTASLAPLPTTHQRELPPEEKLQEEKGGGGEGERTMVTR